MKVNQALAAYISEKTHKGEVIHLTKIKERVGKIEMTIGKGQSTRFAIWEYTKDCKCGQIAYQSSNAYQMATYLQELCGNAHLKNNLPLWKFENKAVIQYV